MTPETKLQSSAFDQRMMRRALDLAARGVGLVSPGPLVGTVIVDAHGEIAGEGFYIFDQVKHAETIALDQAGARTKAATVYVSLEPHAHFGRTTPCTDALIKAGIKRVVAPIEDPNPKVSGRGFAHLREAGIEVSTGLLADEAARLNEAYIHFMRTGRPFVHLKLAVSLDGKVATIGGDSRWITSEEARARVHELRHQSDAIMVGGRTARADDPLLTDRSGRERRRPLVRVVIEQYLRLSPESQLAQTTDAGPVIIFAHEDAEAETVAALQSRGVEVFSQTSSALDLPSVLEELGKRSIQSVLVEGGPFLAGLLLDAGLVNKVTFFIAPMIIGGQDAPSAIAGAGAEKIADALQLECVSVEHRGRDLEITGYPAKGSGQ
ncbi:MAG TPA: bifunctional diaminohydroxyphosphoribosylaminopyrimidine deaminase/5-amino-6-(5-phosphoribosylamino)uracil reductase RibD [Pyrinomonadaceae bacterium]|nr:bifunctional diaminohydroxyphosphoribosylaminopyrimidine deaminase/5-amino-6-(5-phosphoribosylamino)uracil reductase RibD [Pyrinomonadaceae bacterium]